MSQHAKIYVAGHNGLVGSALMRQLQAYGYTNIVTRSHKELDLTDKQKVADFFALEQPEYVFLAAAKVGGIYANNTYPADFIRENINIQQNVIDQAYKHQIKRLLFLGSSCIYPKNCPQPMKEDYLLSGPLELTNRPYAIAKIAGIEMCWSYNRQYHTQYLAVMPTNLYGPNDNYDLTTSHVLPALIRKFHEAKINNQAQVEVWGSGRPKREFLYSDDMADACIFLMNLDDGTYNTLIVSDTNPPLINIGCGEDISILELAKMVKEIVGYSGDIVLNKTKPDGTMRKLLDVENLTRLGWKYHMSLENGIQATYKAYQNNF
ncbi:MAG: GDP-L-fucose synthase [Gammaproteobacteria bacterium]|nr:MAG: GDP-L-fucose synthase [Gammaproteobacteria bacterium]UTW42477.1 GDP-L-fucose synthase [bacterium SCSIO 12844]